MRRDGELGLLARRQWGVVTRSQIAALGGDHRWIGTRLRNGLWSETLPGVLRATSAPECWLMRANEALLWLGRGAVLSHRSAAFALGLTRKEPNCIEALIPADRCVRSMIVRVRRTTCLPSRDVTERLGLRVTNLPRTLLDLARDKDLDELLHAAVFRSRQNLSWLKKRVREDARGRAGMSRLRELVEALSGEEADADSLLEAQLMRLLRRAGLRCVHHYNLVDEEGRFVCEADFVFPAQRLIVQTDGWAYHWNRAAFDTRADLMQRVAALGWRLLPVTWTDVRKRPEEVLRRIRRALEQEAARRGGP